MSEEHVFRINFLNQGKVYEIYARGVSQGGLLGFVEVEGLLFGERTKLIVDSTEEALRTEFEGVRRLYLPIHSVLRIDEVEKAGPGRITEREGGDTKVAPFPFPIIGPHGGQEE
jgi:hypothetical protein